MPDSQPFSLLRIATFNVENLGKPIIPGASLEERIWLLRPQLLRLRADVLCLQEVDSERPRGGGERRLAALDALLADTPYGAFIGSARSAAAKATIVTSTTW